MQVTEIDTPALVLDLEVLEQNIKRAQEYLDRHGVAFRPHIKTHKCPQIARMQVEAGAVGVTCAKLGEAEVMADAGIEDIFLAYPILGSAKLRRLVELAGRCRLTVAFDSLEVAEGISQACATADLRVRALVEIDTGTERCGVSPGPDLLEIYARVAELPGLHLVGLMTYQGYISGTRSERQLELEAEGHRLNQVVADLRAAGLPCDVVSGGTSPSLFLSHAAEVINENRSGTYVFNDRNMVFAGAATWADCALRVAVTNVSTAVPGQLIVDGGSKTFSSDRCSVWQGFGRLVEDPDLLFLKMNEEHGYVRLNGTRKDHPIGERLHVIPNHACTTVNMHEEFVVHRQGEVLERWPIAARGRIR